MQTKVFLSLSHTDADLVRSVHSRLSFGMALFYERSFRNFEDLLGAMERTTKRAQVFCFFVNKESIKSKAIDFEIDRARRSYVFGENIKILVFPTDSEIVFSDLPEWMQGHWVSKAGYNANDIARFITTVLLENDGGQHSGQIVGRGSSLDQLDALASDFMHRRGRSPNVFILPGFSGVGRRTFANYYSKNSIDSLPNLSYGPLLIIPDHAGIEDLFRAVRQEVRTDNSNVIAQDVEAFRALDVAGQAAEIKRLLSHFADLGQAVRIVTASGFFEDDGSPKSWAEVFFTAIPDDLFVFLITNRQFDAQFVDGTENSVQMRVGELNDRDIRGLMVRTASRLKVEGFEISDKFVRAIGGHPDVANAAVKIAQQRGVDALTRDPAYLYNVQQTIIGDLVSPENLNNEEIVVLDSLSWVPELGSDILWEIFRRETQRSEEDFVRVCQGLVDGCTIIPRGYSYQISSAVRHLYRRWNVTSNARLQTISEVLQDQWEGAERRNQFREDLFEAFVFMNALTGSELPEELRRLLSPGTLASVVRETYARGKSEDDKSALDRVVKWGGIAATMEMSEAVREEILGTVCRASIRARKMTDAQKMVDEMREKGYKSTDFLQGHLYRKNREFEKAIPFLELASEGRKFNRSAVHELALAYQGSERPDLLEKLLDRHGDRIGDSAMFLDFEIGREIRAGGNDGIMGKIRRLRAMADDEGQADLREAQVLLNDGQYQRAKEFLTLCLRNSVARPFHVRTLRCRASIRDRDFSLARQDIETISRMAGRKELAKSLEADLEAHKGQFTEAKAAMKEIADWSPYEWRQYAKILDMEADDEPSIARKSELAAEAAKIFGQYGAFLSSEFS